METPFNTVKPLFMHVDLNSCFATIMQQAYFHLRGKPLVIAAYATGNGCVLAPSIEAKRYGIKTGMRVHEAKRLCPQVIIRLNDPDLVRDAHCKFMQIFDSYSPHITPCSIDEALIDFHAVDNKRLDLMKIGEEIKERIRQEVGEWIVCSIGVGPNMFLAKLGASLRKPNGLEMLRAENIKDIYKRLKPLELPGIGLKLSQRLERFGIGTVYEFFKQSEEELRKRIFQSIVGRWWYFRLRGWEVDCTNEERKSFSHEYSLYKKTASSDDLAALLIKLCEKLGQRMRRSGYQAQGISIALRYDDRTHFRLGKTFDTVSYTNKEIYEKAVFLLEKRNKQKSVVHISVGCFNLLSPLIQEGLFSEHQKRRNLSDTLDSINDRFGEFTMTPARFLKAKDLVPDRIAFGRS